MPLILLSYSSSLCATAIHHSSRPRGSIQAYDKSIYVDIHIDTFTFHSIRIFLPESTFSKLGAQGCPKPKHLKSITDSTNKLAQAAPGLIRTEKIALASSRFEISLRKDPRRKSLNPTREGMRRRRRRDCKTL
ncbi:hypothetical protein PIB30_052189, partial [Stylosanthes scabra]|nr:hypothetical protein [Stylosanthes scabra]